MVSINKIIIEKAASFGVRFCWDKKEVIRPENIKNLKEEDIYHCTPIPSDQALFDNVKSLFLNEYRLVNFDGFEVYIRKGTEVGQFVKIGKDYHFLVEYDKLIAINSSEFISKHNKEYYNMLSFKETPENTISTAFILF